MSPQASAQDYLDALLRELGRQDARRRLLVVNSPEYEDAVWTAVAINSQITELRERLLVLKDAA